LGRVKEDGVHVPGLRAVAANFVDGLLLAFSIVGVDGRVLLVDLEWRRER
jgi:hypothetical protein